MVNQLTVAVIGVGYVGEHLVDTFKKNYNIIGIDLNIDRINFLKEKFKKFRNICFQSDYSDLKNCDTFLISVPTLVKNGNIDMSFLYSVRESLKNIVKKKSLIVVESSVYVGATREIFGEFRKKGVYIGFSPERVDPGRLEPKMEDIPKIVSGIDSKSLEKIKTIYSSVIKNIVPVSSLECAEMCKLYENCFRMVNIAYVNEISDMCKEHHIDCYEMINASSTKPFGFMPFYPGVGVGGHCIPVNPYYLFKNGRLPVLELSTEMMNSRPKIKAYDILSKYKHIDNILICGIGFKHGESLLTNSPGYNLYKLLQHQKNVVIFDPYVQKSYNNNDIEFLQEDDIVPLLSQKKHLVINVLPYANHIFKHYQAIGGEVLWYTKP